MLIYDERATLGKKPGLHVLLAGVSHYRHLQGGAGASGGEDYGMGQLFSPSVTVWLISELVKARAAKLATPLATVRLLMSPSQIEHDVICPQGAAAPPQINLQDPALACTRANFSKELLEWRKDAWTNPDNVTLFCFSGHGLQKSSGNIIMLMEDFNDPNGIGGILANTVGSHHVVNLLGPGAAMAPAAMAESRNVARRQFYFIDCCRSTLDLLRKLGEGDVPPVIDAIRLIDKDDRITPQYTGVPGTQNYSVDGQCTLFGEALLDCLSNVGGKPVDAGRGAVWTVTAFSLLEYMNEHLQIANLRHGTNQECRLSGVTAKDVPLLYLDGPPDVKVELQIEPPHAVICAHVSLTDPRQGGQACNLPKPLNTNPFETTLKAGSYFMSVAITPPTPPFEDKPMKEFVANWPRRLWTVMVTA